MNHLRSGKGPKSKSTEGLNENKLSTFGADEAVRWRTNIPLMVKRCVGFDVERLRGIAPSSHN